MNRDPISQVMESRSSVLGSHAGPYWNYGTMECVKILTLA